MNCDNNASRIRKRILLEVASLTVHKRLVEDIDRLPLTLHPRTARSMRCCIHKDRAVARARLIAALGHRVETETDELTPLHHYAQAALERTRPQGPVLTVIDEACSSCLHGHHLVTNVCRGCVARPCTLNCPKNAIEMVNGQARIDEERCVDCGLCMKVCPYHAIVYVPVPCEEVCPVKALTKDEQGRESIDTEKCISCGKCLDACPFGAIMERSQMVDVLTLVQQPGRPPVVAMVAPAVAGQFPNPYAQILAAALALGFDEVVDVGHSAQQTAIDEAAEWQERIEGGAAFMTTSCCPAYVQLAKRNIAPLQPFISHTPSPMHTAAASVKARQPEAITVFIGPCTAKRAEAYDDEAVDYVLTTEEFGAMLYASAIEIERCTPLVDHSVAPALRFGFSGGVTQTVGKCMGSTQGLKAVLIDGLDKKAVSLLKSFAQGRCTGNFVEVMSCSGGCVAGPVTLEKPAKAKGRIEKLLT
jgi:[FeFe] hydrogenase (group B1/B3)